MCIFIEPHTVLLYYQICSTAWHHEYLALPDGPGRFTQNFSCSALLRIKERLVWDYVGHIWRTSQVAQW